MVNSDIEHFDPFDGAVGFALASRVGDTVWVSGMVGMRDDLTVPEGIGEQTKVVYDNITKALEHFGVGLDRIVSQTTYVVGDAALMAAEIRAVRAELFGDVVTSSTLVGVSSLVDPRYKVEISVVASLDPS